MSTKCITPFYLNNDEQSNLPLPCGKCPPCIKRKVSGWSFRLMKEGEVSSSSFFITLTYNYDNVPITPKGFMNLSKRDLQLYFKRLRKLIYGNSKSNIKYYAVGEYGGKTNRPHYHIILFNVKSIEKISQAWQLGHIHYGTLTEASIGYTLKYVSKPSKVPLHKNDDRQKEFSLMSKGLGKSYITKNMIKWHHADLEKRMYVNLKDGKKASMPRYYKNKIYDEQQRAVISRYIRDESYILEQKEKEIHGENYEFIRSERALNEFRKMYRSSQQNQKI